MKRTLVGGGVAMSVALAACVPAAVPLEIDARAAPGARMTVVVYADDGGGCDALAFVAAPALPVLLSAVAPFDAVDIPRSGDKLVVVDAAVDGVSVARGCAAVGSEVDNNALRIVLAPTRQLVDAEAATLVIAEGARRGAVTVVDAAGAAVSGAAVQVRLIDSAGQRVGDVLSVVADDAGRVVVAPTVAPAGPVRVELVVERPASPSPMVLSGFAPPTVVPVPAAVSLRPFLTSTGAAFAGVEAAGIVVVDLVAGAPATARTVPTSPTARLAGVLDAVLDGEVRQWVIVDAGVPALVSDVDGAVVAAAEPALVDNGAAVRFIAAGACGRSTLPGIISTAAEQALLTLVDGALLATAVPADRRVVRSACALDETGAAHRLLVLGGSTASVVDVGGGLTSVEALTAAAPISAGLERSRAFFERHDGALVSVEADGAEVLLRPLKLAAGAFVDAGAAVVRMPAAPLVVASGACGGDDVIGLYDAAMFGVGADVDGAPITAGLQSDVCTGAGCADAIVADVDGDGPVELLLPQATGSAIVHFR